MKLISKALAAMSSSLEETIEVVTTQSSCFVQAIGFSSLPDDVVARIFEVCKTLGSLSSPKDISPQAQKLSGVCRRFRRIALHVPGLWEDISNSHKTDWILKVQERCLNPFVHIWCPPKRTEEERIPAFLQLLHPSNQWRGLSLECEQDKAHQVFDLISTASGGNFGSMSTLSMALNWHDEEHRYGLRSETPRTNILDSDAALLSTWRLDSLRELTIKNFIPRKIDCTNLRTCSISLSRRVHQFTWDLHALKNFFRSIHLVETMSLTIVFALSPAQYYNTVSDTVLFPQLTSLRIKVDGDTESRFIGDILNMMLAVNLTKLEVVLDDCNVRGGGALFSWLREIFEPPSWRSEDFQKFPNVTTLFIHLHDERDEIKEIPLRDVLPAVPRVQDFSLRFSDGLYCDLSRIFKLCKDVRSVRVDKSPIGDEFWRIQRVLSELDEKNELGKLEYFELGGYDTLYPCREEFEKILGNKLVLKFKGIEY